MDGFLYAISLRIGGANALPALLQDRFNNFVNDFEMRAPGARDYPQLHAWCRRQTQENA
jgi:hypothetical protein